MQPQISHCDVSFYFFLTGRLYCFCLWISIVGDTSNFLKGEKITEKKIEKHVTGLQPEVEKEKILERTIYDLVYHKEHRE